MTGEEPPSPLWRVELCSPPSRWPNPIPAIPPYVGKTPHLHGAPTTEEHLLLNSNTNAGSGIDLEKKKNVKVRNIFFKRQQKKKFGEKKKEMKKKIKEKKEKRPQRGYFPTDASLPRPVEVLFCSPGFGCFLCLEDAGSPLSIWSGTFCVCVCKVWVLRGRDFLAKCVVRASILDLHQCQELKHIYFILREKREKKQTKKKTRKKGQTEKRETEKRKHKRKKSFFFGK